MNVKYPVDDCKAILQQHIQQLRQKTWDELGPPTFAQHQASSGSLVVLKTKLQAKGGPTHQT